MWLRRYWRRKPKRCSPTAVRSSRLFLDAHGRRPNNCFTRNREFLSLFPREQVCKRLPCVTWPRRRYSHVSTAPLGSVGTRSLWPTANKPTYWRQNGESLSRPRWWWTHCGRNITRSSQWCTTKPRRACRIRWTRSRQRRARPVRTP